MSGEAVKVIVRCRPLNAREKALNCKTIIEMDQSIGQVRIIKPDTLDQPPKPFTFDGVYHIDSITENIYADIAYPLVEGVLEGYNGTIFAYGQTGCGKSFTMQGITDPPSQRGIIPRAFEHIFESMQTADAAKYLVHASYLEIYNEEIRDLMGKDHKQRLEIKEHPDKGVYVKDLSMIPCHNVADMDRVMDTGGKNRSVGATLMNADSSRSHSIFTIFVETCESSGDGNEHFRAGKLNLVDLAGSERQAKTGATGDRLKEATKINLSLSALGNVISSLVDGKSKHIPYRDSKLTRLLQDSLGGNTKTLMVSCVSPADNNYEETLSTLRYANRAKNIKNKPKINEDPKDALLRQYQEEIQMLKKLLMGQGDGDVTLLDKLGVSGGGLSAGPAMGSRLAVTASPSESVESAETKESSRDSSQEEIQKIRDEYETRIADMEKKFIDEQTDKEKLRDELQRVRSDYTMKMKAAEQLASSSPDSGVIVDHSAENNNHIRTDSSHSEEKQYVLAQDSTNENNSQDNNLTLFREKHRQSPSIIKQLQNEAQKMQLEAAKGIGLLKSKLLSGSQQELAVSVSKKDGQISDPTFSMPDAGSLQIQGKGALGSITHHLQEEALRKLQALQEQLVGGEKRNDQSLKAKRKARKEHALSKREKMKQAAKSIEGDTIMVKVYDNLQDEIKAKSRQLNRLDSELKAANIEIGDLQSEFERDRQDYLDTIRKLEQQVKLQQQILDKVQPCIRRDCNYYNLDRIRTQSKWNEEYQHWDVPELVIEKTSLPQGLPPGPRTTLLSQRQPNNAHQPRAQSGDVPAEYFDDARGDKFLRHLNDRSREEAANAYFKPKRAEQLLCSSTAGPLDSRKPFHTNDSGLDLSLASDNVQAMSPSAGLALAGPRPIRLESLPQSAFEKKKKKPKNYGLPR